MVSRRRRYLECSSIERRNVSKRHMTSLTAKLVQVSAVFIVFSRPDVALAQTPERLAATAVRGTEAPTIDGSLDEAAWDRATPITGFVQAEPLEGQPASERTDVRLLYD